MAGHRIAVDQQNALPLEELHRSGEVHCDRGLADPAFRVEDDDHTTVQVLHRPRNLDVCLEDGALGRLTRRLHADQDRFHAPSQ
jgi:hypothetical protein